MNLFSKTDNNFNLRKNLGNGFDNSQLMSGNASF